MADVSDDEFVEVSIPTYVSTVSDLEASGKAKRLVCFRKVETVMTPDNKKLAFTTLDDGGYYSFYLHKSLTTKKVGTNEQGMAHFD